MTLSFTVCDVVGYGLWCSNVVSIVYAKTECVATIYVLWLSIHYSFSVLFRAYSYIWSTLSNVLNLYIFVYFFPDNFSISHYSRIRVEVDRVWIALWWADQDLINSRRVNPTVCISHNRFNDYHSTKKIVTFEFLWKKSTCRKIDSNHVFRMCHNAHLMLYFNVSYIVSQSVWPVPLLVTCCGAVGHGLWHCRLWSVGRNFCPCPHTPFRLCFTKHCNIYIIQARKVRDLLCLLILGGDKVKNWWCNTWMLFTYIFKMLFLLLIIRHDTH